MKVVLIGDSIRMGYQPVVTAKLGDRAEVCGPECNGGDSSNVLAHLGEWVNDRDVDLVHLNCGLHDLRYRADGTYQVPIDQYRDNLAAIMDGIKGDLPNRLIWASTTPVVDARQSDGGAMRRFNRDVIRYNDAALSIMQERGVPVNDLYRVVTEAGAEEHMSPDGVHFTEAGYELLAGAVVDAIMAAAG